MLILTFSLFLIFILLFNIFKAKIVKLLFYINAVKQLIAINRIQNKYFCLHNMNVYGVYLLCIYI